MPLKIFSLNSLVPAAIVDSIKLNSLLPEMLRPVRVKQKLKHTNLMLAGFEVEVTQKKIKHLHLKVCPPNGTVRISAPLHLSQEKIHKFALSKLAWITKQKKRMQIQPQSKPVEYTNAETHYFRGQSYCLRIIENNKIQFAELRNNQLYLQVPEGADTEIKRAVLDAWYRLQLMELIPPLIKKWELKMNVTVKHFSIRSMKTRWGSCTPKTGRIRFNLELVKKSPECLEYIVVHELAHLLEASHNNRFKELMDQYYPDWKLYRKELRSVSL